MNFVKTYYHDFLVGTQDQSPEAWHRLPYRIAAPTYAAALDTLTTVFKVSREDVIRIQRYILKDRKGLTVMVFKAVDFQDLYKGKLP